MSFVLLRPVALAGAVAIAAIVLLHVIQSRWRRRVLPSLIIWRRVLARGVAVRARRPSLDLPLVLAVAAAALLTFAAAEPKLVSVAGGDDELVIVIDNGTSSLTESERGPTRFAESARRAGSRLARLPAGGRAALVATSPEPRVVAPLAEGGVVARMLDGLAPLQVTGSLESAVALALSQGSGTGRVVVYTSRALAATPPRVTLVPVGRPSRNVAVTHADFSRTEAFCAIRNFSARDVEARVSLGVRAGERAAVVAGRRTSLPAGGRAAIVFAPSGEELSAYAAADAVFVAAEHVADDLAADDTAWGARSHSGAERVALVGETSEPLSRALRAARAETVSLTGAPGAPFDDIDLVIYSGAVPDDWPPAGPVVLVAPERSVGPVRLLGEEVRDVKAHFSRAAGAAAGASELVRGFPPVELRVRRAAKARILSARDPLLVSAGDGEVLAAAVHDGGGEGSRRHVYLGFRPEDSDWPQRASFPVFVRRLLESTASGEAKRGDFRFARVGESAAGHLPPGARTVVLPGGTERPPEARLVAAGLYSVRSAKGPRGDGRGLLAVNLVSEAESDNRLAGERTTGTKEPAASPPAGKEALPARRVTARDLAGAAAAIGLVLLAAEWLVTARRT